MQRNSPLPPVNTTQRHPRLQITRGPSASSGILPARLPGQNTQASLPGARAGGPGPGRRWRLRVLGCQEVSETRVEAAACSLAGPRWSPGEGWRPGGHLGIAATPTLLGGPQDPKCSRAAYLLGGTENQGGDAGVRVPLIPRPGQQAPAVLGPCPWPPAGHPRSTSALGVQPTLHLLPVLQRPRIRGTWCRLGQLRAPPACSAKTPCIL